MRYIKKFINSADTQMALNNDELSKPYVAYYTENQELDFNGLNKYEPYTLMPLTFEIVSAGTICFKRAGTTIEDKTITYSKDYGSTWSDLTSSTAGTEIYVDEGDIIQFKGDNAGYGDGVTVNPSSAKNSYCSLSGSTAIYNAYGNIMSLINSTGFSIDTTFTEKFSFRRFFAYTNLVDSENLRLPATSLTENCYSGMFSNCTGMTVVPELPATSIPASGYAYMFEDCASLTTVPSDLLPATSIASNSYGYMFQRCYSLQTAPNLPATTLAPYCYWYMFYNSSGLTSAPELPATTLAHSCYTYMFNGCTNLNYIKCLATDISAQYCTNNWVQGVASTGTFVKKTGADWSSKTGNNGIPNNWTVIEEV